MRLTALTLKLLALALASTSAAGAGPGPSVQTDEPRAFGYSVGDVIERELRLDVPQGLSLDRASLPTTRRPGQALELRSAVQDGDVLRLRYQVFLSPTAVRTLEIAPLMLRFAGPAGEHVLRVEAWPVTVAPLVPQAVSPRTGLGELRPDASPPLVNTGPARLRLLAAALLLALTALVLAQVYLGLPWWRRRHRPFGRAWPQLRTLPDQATPAQQTAAYSALHEALNESAGRALFAHDLPAFVVARPGFAALQPQLAEFFARSRQAFFELPASAPGATAHSVATPQRPDAARWLRTLGRACRDAERGSA